MLYFEQHQSSYDNTEVESVEDSEEDDNGLHSASVFNTFSAGSKKPHLTRRFCRTFYNNKYHQNPKLVKHWHKDFQQSSVQAKVPKQQQFVQEPSSSLALDPTFMTDQQSDTKLDHLPLVAKAATVNKSGKKPQKSWTKKKFQKYQKRLQEISCKEKQQIVKKKQAAELEVVLQEDASYLQRSSFQQTTSPGKQPVDTTTSPELACQPVELSQLQLAEVTSAAPPAVTASEKITAKRRWFPSNMAPHQIKPQKAQERQMLKEGGPMKMLHGYQRLKVQEGMAEEWEKKWKDRSGRQCRGEKIREEGPLFKSQSSSSSDEASHNQPRPSCLTPRAHGGRRGGWVFPRSQQYQLAKDYTSQFEDLRS